MNWTDPQGANWASYASTPDEKRRDTITWHRFAELAKELPDVVQETEAVYAFDEEGGYSPPWYEDLTRNVRVGFPHFLILAHCPLLVILAGRVILLFLRYISI